MIKIENVTFTYPGAVAPSLKNINIHIEKGDFVAIVGSNGCGKSTLCKTLNGLIPNYLVGDFQGSVTVGDKDTTEVSLGELALKVGYVYQDFENQIVRPTVLDDASFACLNYAMPDYIEKGRLALKQVGLDIKENEFIWQLSGGQKHLLALAGVAALTPDVLVLDEPIAQLDPIHSKQIYEVLRSLNETYGKTILVIEHHTEFIAQYCKSVILMKEGEICWKLDTKQALNRVEELVFSNIYPPQITLAAYQLLKKGIINKTVLPTTLEEGQCYFNGLELRPLITQQPPCVSSDTIISFEKISMDYRAVKGKNRQVFDGLSLDIKKGEKIALIGNNGAGKSTLMKLMMGLIKPAAGNIRIYGQDTRSLTSEFISQKISYVYQNPEQMFIQDSIRNDIEFAMKVRKIKDYEQRTQQLMELFDLNPLEHRDGRLLSGGQMRRASLAIGLALTPSILLLDEPTANLDIATRTEIVNSLARVKNQVETIIIATHDMQLVTQWADRIIVLCEGKIIADGKKEKIFTNPYILQQAAITPPEIYHMAKALQSKAQCFTVEEFLESIITNERVV